MKALFLLPLFLATTARADFVSVQADHANFLYTVGQKAELALHLDSVPSGGESIENHILFPGQAEVVLPFSKDNLVFITPELTAGVKDISILVHAVDKERRAADSDAISSTQEKIAYWQDRLQGETNPQTIAMIQDRISSLNAQLAALQADLATTDQVVQNIAITLQVNPSGI